MTAPLQKPANDGAAEMVNPLELVAWAFQHYPEQVGLNLLDNLVIDSARQNDKHDSWVKVRVPDDYVKRLQKGGERDMVVLIMVPKSVLDRKKSKIILPTETSR